MENLEQKDFKQIFEEYMEAYKNGGLERVEELVENNGLSKDAKDTLAKANELLKKIRENKDSMEESRSLGISAEEWMATKLNEIVSKN